MTKTTITLDSSMREQLARRKVHPRESYAAVIKRLLKKPTLKASDVDQIESMLATAELLSDPKAMRAIAQGIEDVKAGRLHSIDEV